MIRLAPTSTLALTVALTGGCGPSDCPWYDPCDASAYVDTGYQATGYGSGPRHTTRWAEDRPDAVKFSATFGYDAKAGVLREVHAPDGSLVPPAIQIFLTEGSYVGEGLPEDRFCRVDLELGDARSRTTSDTQGTFVAFTRDPSAETGFNCQSFGLSKGDLGFGGDPVRRFTGEAEPWVAVGPAHVGMVDEWLGGDGSMVLGGRISIPPDFLVDGEPVGYVDEILTFGWAVEDIDGAWWVASGPVPLTQSEMTDGETLSTGFYMLVQPSNFHLR